MLNIAASLAVGLTPLLLSTTAVTLWFPTFFDGFAPSLTSAASVEERRLCALQCTLHAFRCTVRDTEYTFRTLAHSRKLATVQSTAALMSHQRWSRTNRIALLCFESCLAARL